MPPGPKGPRSMPGKSGGRRPSFSGLGEARLQEQALADAAQQKNLSQQAGDSSQSSTGGSALGASDKGQGGPSQQRLPRKVGSLKQELVTRPAADVRAELGAFFDINKLLGINTEDSPEEKAKKKQMLARWQKLTKAEQKVAQEKYQKKLKEKQEEEKRKQLKKQKEEEQKKKQALAPPSSPKKGPGMFAQGQSSQSKAQQRLQQQRQTIGTMGSPN